MARAVEQAAAGGATGRAAPWPGGAESLGKQGKPIYAKAPPIAMLGVPFDNVTVEETVALIDEMVASRRPHYLATANVDFLVQAMHDVELRRILFEAHLVLCDGTPLVWASKWLGNALPERVAGSDLVPLLIQMASEKGYRLYFLGGSPASTEGAAKRLRAAYPGLEIAGHYSPPFSHLLEMDHEEITRRIREARPDLLFVAFGCPKQEKWINMHYRDLGVPVAVGVGATIDFLAGTMRRAPVWMQKSGTEWIFRMLQEPRRLVRRYFKDVLSFGGPFWCQYRDLQWRRRRVRPAPPAARVPQERVEYGEVVLPECMDMETVRRSGAEWELALAGAHFVVVRVDAVGFIDSTGVGFLIRLQKKARDSHRRLLLSGASPAVERALQAMRLQEFFEWVRDEEALAERLCRDSESGAPRGPVVRDGTVYWYDEITAANAKEVWNLTEQALLGRGDSKDEVVIDLQGVRFVDSTGLSLMIRAKKLMARDGVQVRFDRVQPLVRSVVQLSRLEDYLLDGRE